MTNRGGHAAHACMFMTWQDRPDFVTMRIGGRASAAGISSNRDIHRRRRIMTWQTPQAIDVRLGFEITMYISNR
jgi:coenzyme PQQ precursor peptide PqqA